MSQGKADGPSLGSRREHSGANSGTHPDSHSPTGAGNSWRRYWQGAANGAAKAPHGATHLQFTGFWRTTIEGILGVEQSPCIVDVASGSGAVIDAASAVDHECRSAWTALDLSVSALMLLRSRFPDVLTVSADASALPFPDGCFHAATSQFGIEYAGPGAIAEVARIISPGGCLALLIHHREGRICHEASRDIEAVQELIESEFLHLAMEMFRAGFDAIRGGSLAAYEASVAAIRPAFSQLEHIIRHFGKGVAGGMIWQLYHDVARINERIQYHDPAQVLAWLQQTESELDPFLARLKSTRDAALDSTDMERLRDEFSRLGFDIHRMSPLHDAGQAQPLAWALIGHKSGGGR